MIDWSIYLALNKGGSKVKGSKVQKTGGIKTGVARGGGGVKSNKLQNNEGPQDWQGKEG